MPHSVYRGNQVLDIVASRQHPEVTMAPVWLTWLDENRKSQRELLCQVLHDKFGWTVVVAGHVAGRRLVEGFQSRRKAIAYAVAIRRDLNDHSDRELADAAGELWEGPL